MVDRWERNLERRPMSTGGFWALCVVAIVLIIVSFVWALHVLTSPVRGAGDAYAEKNGAGNFIAQQHYFFATHEDYKATIQKITDARNTVKTEQTAQRPADGLAAYEAQRQLTADQATVQQLTQHCQDDAAGYNTAAQAYLSEDFRGAGLPYRLDPAVCSTS
jgi:hypothetical protein